MRYLYEFIAQYKSTYHHHKSTYTVFHTIIPRSTCTSQLPRIFPNFQVVVADLNEAAACAVASGIKGLAVRCNVAEEMDLRRLLSVAETLGPVEVFVANAGIPCNGGYEAGGTNGLPWKTW